MKILHLYLIRTVLYATFLVMIVVMGLSYFINFLRELRDIGVGDYGILQAAMHVLLEMPHDLYQFFPMIVLLGGLTGLGVLSSHQELIVMRISGMSISNMTSAVLGSAIILTVLGLIIGEVISPHLHHLADKHKSSAQSEGQAVATVSGVWIHIGNNFFHIDRVVTHHFLEGVTRYEFDNQHRLLATYYAKTMHYHLGQWKLSDVVKTTFTSEGASSVFNEKTTWDVNLKPRFLNVGLLEPDEMPLPSLIEYTKHLEKNGLQSSDFELNFWKRLFQPLTTLVMLLLAIPFVFTAPRSLTMGFRLVIGILVGFIFHIISALIGQVSIVFQLSPFYAALLPLLIFALIGYGLMLRVV